MRLYATTNDAVLVVIGSPDGSTTRRQLGGHRVECVAADLCAPNRTLCRTFDAGVFRTTDGRALWRVASIDALPKSMANLAVSLATLDAIYAGTEPSAVFHPRDGGETWTKLAPLSTLDSASP